MQLVMVVMLIVVISLKHSTKPRRSHRMKSHGSPTSTSSSGYCTFPPAIQSNMLRVASHVIPFVSKKWFGLVDIGQRIRQGAESIIIFTIHETSLCGFSVNYCHLSFKFERLMPHQQTSKDHKWRNHVSWQGVRSKPQPKAHIITN